MANDVSRFMDTPQYEHVRSSPNLKKKKSDG